MPVSSKFHLRRVRCEFIENIRSSLDGIRHKLQIIGVVHQTELLHKESDVAYLCDIILVIACPGNKGLPQFFGAYAVSDKITDDIDESVDIFIVARKARKLSEIVLVTGKDGEYGVAQFHITARRNAGPAACRQDIRCEPNKTCYIS